MTFQASTVQSPSTPRRHAPLQGMMQTYHAWVEANIAARKTAEEFHNAIGWMERNQAVVRPLLDAGIEHPGLQFSHVIESLIDSMKEDATHRSVMIDWLVEDHKVPCGKILKTKALRKLRKLFKRLDPTELGKLELLYDKLEGLEFKPSEFKWLQRINEKTLRVRSRGTTD